MITDDRIIKTKISIFYSKSAKYIIVLSIISSFLNIVESFLNMDKSFIDKFQYMLVISMVLIPFIGIVIAIQGFHMQKNRFFELLSLLILFSIIIAAILKI
ncbi:MAG: hypothetical protein LDL13_05880 [Calditerrivibrio sp.]|nr:hypothetical protein [Calditerrivibrio sp.]MCA1933086.1 hypothetical protein [Calditerrivibrio sp.]MCA1980242.1 hypothetical protein [Calditerrivibrio sp.]